MIPELSFLEEMEMGQKLGVDAGSTSTKFAFLKDGRISTSIMDTSRFLYGKMAECLVGFDVVSTGYGRKRIPSARPIPEIRAHTLGVLKSTGLEDFTLLDIGGQDFKVVRVEKKGIRDFHMNDKCAAGTGRFLEKMSAMLGMSMAELGSFRGNEKILESVCSVFTETELISLMVEGATRERLAEGVIFSVYERVRPLLRMFPCDTIVFTGGVSRCSGLAMTISVGLSVDVMVPERSQFMGAIGALSARNVKNPSKALS
ncbi:MAG: 2-hydroxyglutaryl-CoA dehydratase [Candidatus Thermoplasmatota archaeon]|nr:2-hydroxyglutaryl-CoA dehydratase [Candidatus Thermoplasmatota archaeon]